MYFQGFDLDKIFSPFIRFSCFIMLLFVAALLAGTPMQAVAQSRGCKDPTPASNINEMFDAIFACWQPPEDAEGLVVTLRFILHRDGQVRNKVVVVGVSPQEDSPRRKAFIDSAIEAVRRAEPVPFTEEFGSRIAGRPIEPRFLGSPRRASTNNL
ncbi:MULTISPECIES: energy transducer TonB [Agrobacterium]|uniref:energy transducer TonB n=1 Tax=Agrobacterium TaxID=357 RepID=UPI001BB7BF5E|nr:MULTISPECIES: hypothetical protein [Agrobacterium]QTK78518.1 hypothetical protein AT6N2_C0648 [Agrobacterium tumefaciens]